MKVQTLVGIYGWERTRKQALVLDLEVSLPERAAARDDIADTIHYGEICEAVRRELSDSEFGLLETLAEFVAQLLIDEFGARQVRVRVTKPGILPDVREVGVEIERAAA